jgi:tight adherence protein B
MLTTVVFCFVVVFVVVFLALYLMSTRAANDLKQTLARLDEIAGAVIPRRAPERVDILREDILSDIPWLNDLLHSFNIFPAIRKMLSQADLDWKLNTVLLLSLFLWLGTGLLVYMRTEVLFVAVLLGAVAACAPWAYILHKRSKRFAEFEEKLPEALDLMVSAIRAGHGFASAINLASRENMEPIAGEFRQCFDEQNFGLDLRVAMSNLADRMPIPDVKLLVSAVLIQKESGGNLAEILEKAAYLIRERFRLKRQVRVHTAQGRMTGWIMTFTPVALGFLLYLLDPDQMSVLWKRDIGQTLLWTAVIMDLIGALIIRKIVRAQF